MKRVYYIWNVPSGRSRGDHAHLRQRSLLMAASGSFDLTTDDGSHDNDGLPQNREELKLTKEDMNDIETKGPVGNETAFNGIGPFLQQGLNYDYDDVTGVLTISGKITKAYDSDNTTNVPGFGTPQDMLTSKLSKYVTFIPIPVGDSWMLWAVSSLTKADTTVSANHGGNGNKAFYHHLGS